MATFDSIVQRFELAMMQRATLLRAGAGIALAVAAHAALIERPDGRPNGAPSTTEPLRTRRT